MAQIKYQIAKQIECVDAALEGQFLAQIKYQIFEQIRCVDAALWDGCTHPILGPNIIRL